MIDEGLLKILRCPENHEPLLAADVALLAQLNARVAAGELKNRGGQLVEGKLDGALVRADRAVAYAVRDQIPIMLLEEGIPLK